MTFRPADPAAAPDCLWVADSHLDPPAWRVYAGVPHAFTPGVVAYGRDRLDPLAGARAAAYRPHAPAALHALLDAAAALPCPDPVEFPTRVVQAVEDIAAMPGRFRRTEAYAAWRPLTGDHAAPYRPDPDPRDHPAESTPWTWNPDEM